MNSFKVETPGLPPVDPLRAALRKTLAAAEQEAAGVVIAAGNAMIEGAHSGRLYGAHQAAAPGEAAANLDGVLMASAKVKMVADGDKITAIATWTAPHAHLQERGFMHKPHRPDAGTYVTKSGRVRNVKKKKWGDERPLGSVFVPPHPFCRPAGMKTKEAGKARIVAAISACIKGFFGK